MFEISDAVTHTRNLDELYREIHQSLDKILNVKAENRELAVNHMSTPGVSKLLTILAAGDREFAVTDRGITLNINRVIKKSDDFKKELANMSALANLLIPQGSRHPT